jgi:transposase InsO family protein
MCHCWTRLRTTPTKQELGDPNRFSSIDKLIEALGSQFRAYNSKRIHSTLKKTPDAFFAQAMQVEERIRMRAKQPQN